MTTIDSLSCRYSVGELEAFQKTIEPAAINKFYKCDIRALGVYKTLMHLLNRNPDVELDAVILCLNKSLRDRQKKYYDMALQGKNSSILFKQSPNNILSSLPAIALKKQIHTVTIFADNLTYALSYAQAYEDEYPQTAVVCAVEADGEDIIARAELLFLQRGATNTAIGSRFRRRL